MKVWIYIEQSEDWEMIAECPDHWANWVANTLHLQNPKLHVEYGTVKPGQPLKLDFKKL